MPCPAHTRPLSLATDYLERKRKSWWSKLGFWEKFWYVGLSNKSTHTTALGAHRAACKSHRLNCTQSNTDGASGQACRCCYGLPAPAQVLRGTIHYSSGSLFSFIALQVLCWSVGCSCCGLHADRLGWKEGSQGRGVWAKPRHLSVAVCNSSSLLATPAATAAKQIAKFSHIGFHTLMRCMHGFDAPTAHVLYSSHIVYVKLSSSSRRMPGVSGEIRSCQRLSAHSLDHTQSLTLVFFRVLGCADPKTSCKRVHSQSPLSPISHKFHPE